MKNKVFGIGLNKTGTTSLGMYFKSLGYRLYQRPTYQNVILAKNNINQLIPVINEYDVFEDWPWPLIYKKLYDLYPNAKFILTIREDPDKWFDSLQRHCLKRPNTKQRKIIYGYYNANNDNKVHHINYYKKHVKDVIDFFEKKDNSRLLILNTDKDRKEEKINAFLGIPYNENNYIKYPHYNKNNK